jgi:glutathione S-transferase
MSAMKLYIGNKNLSSWSMRPWFLMRHAGIAFEEHALLFEQPDFRDVIAKASPSRRVPVLHDGEIVVHDSLAICEYLAERFPEKHLWPADERDRAVARAVSCEMHAGFADLRNELSMDVTARNVRRERSAAAESDIRRVEEILSKAKGPFLFGDFSIADAMFAPVVWRFRTYEVALRDATARGWYERMLALPAMQEWERDARAEVRECWAVIFTSKLRASAEGYGEAANRMVELAKNEPGFLGIESARGADGVGITVSYWDSLEAIAKWREHAEHKPIQARGRESFYERYELRVSRVVRGVSFP